MHDMPAMLNILVGLLALGGMALLTLYSRKYPHRITRPLHDAPVFVMYLLGLWLLAPIGWLYAAGYAAAVLASNLWFLVTVCSRCACHGCGNGPSLYCAMAGRLAKRGDLSQFARSFRRNTKVIAIGWVLPPLGAAVLCVQTFGRGWTFAGHLVLLAAFSLIAFWLLPVSAKPKCGRCANRERCPHGQRARRAR